MALHPPQTPELTDAEEKARGKLIFAPAPSTSGPGQAGQFTRHERRGGLRRSDLDPASPIRQFHAWFGAAKEGGDQPKIAHPETCTLATASLPSGRVSARVVYLKELDARGFVVYSNFATSRKAADLFGMEFSVVGGDAKIDGEGGEKKKPNPWAALTFWWEPLERQVRVEGLAERLPRAESQAYFDTRVRGSRVGAWASAQSSVLRPDPSLEGDDGRAELERRVAEAEARFAGVDDIPVPEFWGGLRIVPRRVEFWQGRENRLHDRFVYEWLGEGEEGKEGEGEGGKWALERLSP